MARTGAARQEHRYGRRFLWLALIAAGLLASGSLWPDALLPSEGGLDKWAHGAVYAALAFCLPLLLPDLRRALLAGLALFALGLLMEAAQLFLPGRWASLEDAAANGAGILLGWVLGWALGWGISRLAARRRAAAERP